MDEKNEEKNSPEIDLSELSSLSLEPSWASAEKPEKFSVERFSRDDRRRDDRRGGNAGNPRERRPRFGDRPPRRDRPPFGGSAPAGEDRPRAGGKFGGKPFRGHGRGGPHGSAHAPAPRVVEAAFLPEEKPFSVLVKAAKASARTYALFEIASLILEKPERFSVTVKPFVRPPVPAKKSPAGAPEKSAPAASVPEVPVTGANAETKPAPQLYIAVPDGMPFLNEADAIAYVFDRHADKFFSVETVEVDPPKGNYTMVAKCGFSGELLAPPNYSEYRRILRDWHAANFPRMPYEKFLARLEIVKDADSVNAWLAKMKTVTRYTVKDRAEGEPETLDGAGAAKAFLLANRKEKAVRAAPSARFSGKLLEQMPMGPMKTGIENELAFQRRFPLDTANFLRGRLRRVGLTLFKLGKKNITYICAVHRKFRTPESVFSDTIQRVFDFLEKHPNTKIGDLPKLMLGIGDEPAAVPAETVPAETVPAEAAENAESAANVESAPAAAPAESVPAENAEKTENSDRARRAEIEAQIASLLGTVRWLVLEGYVSEFSDGSLVTYPKMSKPPAKAPAKTVAAEEKAPVPAETAPEDVPAETAENAESVPAETVPEEPVPAEATENAETVPAETVSEAVPEENSSEAGTPAA